MKKIVFGVVSLFISLSAVAAEVPTSQEVKKVLDFYYDGKGLGVVLIEAKMCRDIEREGDQKNECSGQIAAGEAITKDEAAYLWMSYMVPSGDEKQKIIVQFDNGGVTRSVKDMEVSGSLRFRTWRKVVFDRAGQWTAKIVHDKPEGAVELGQISFNVQ